MAARSLTRRSEIPPVTGNLCPRSKDSIALLVASSSTPEALIWPYPNSAKALCTAAIRDDGPISSAIGSLRRAAMGCGTTVAAAGRSEAVGAAAFGELFSITCNDFEFAKNGDGCGPDCKNTALTTMMRLAAAAARIATKSTGRRVALMQSLTTNDPQAPAARAKAGRLSCRRLRTFLHRELWTRQGHLAHRGATRRMGRRIAGYMTHHGPGRPEGRIQRWKCAFAIQR